MGEESDTDSSDEPEPEDLGDEWDKTKCGDWLHCPSPPLVKAPHGQRLPQKCKGRSSGKGHSHMAGGIQTL